MAKKLLREPNTLIALLACTAFVFCLAGCKKNSSTQPGSGKAKLAPPVIKSAEEQQVYDLILAEDLVLDLSPQLAKLAEWFEQKSTPTETTPEPAFEAPFKTLQQCQGLLDADPETIFHTSSDKPDFMLVGEWPVEDSLKPGMRNPWEPLDKLGANLETIKFGVISASFDDDSKTSFTLHTKSEGRGLSQKGEARFGFKGHQDLTWTKTDEAWNLTSWKQTDFHAKKSSQPLFEDVLKSALKPNTIVTLRKAQRSYKDEFLIKASETGEMPVKEPKYKAFTSAASNYLFPAVSVVDFDNDGLDDLFLTARWGPTQMLRNLGDGTFKEVTRDVGLYFKNMVNCSLFADFDNDGDQDVLLGRPLESAVYLENVDGKFKDVTKFKSNLNQLYFVSAISVSDVNKDGLLDVYLSTYAPLREDRSWGSAFITPEELALVLSHQDGRNRHLDLAGPANVLMMNRGKGKLERVPFDEELSQWRRSFQSAWADIDNDGDDDLYICSDFAPDALLRNDTPTGAKDPKFTDVTKEVLKEAGMGFGMGASYGDFDRDGDLDLYVSNMFSKAGRRIIKQVDSVDPRTAAAAAGNFLFVNEDGKFGQKAGSAPDQFPVNQVGWSYGGQWCDFDNNGQLDLYVPSGYYTAPKEISSQVDT